jgi:hypothetical protein
MRPTIQELKELAEAYTLGDELTPGEMHDICEAFLELLTSEPTQDLGYQVMVLEAELRNIDPKNIMLAKSGYEKQ